MDYPVWNVAIGGGLLMAIVAIPHVIVSHFAVGGGLLIAVSETLAVKRDDPALRDLARRSSLVLVLVSTVFGAISGVGIWVVAGLISPGAISALIHTYVWGWAIEWVFFIIEIVAALAYYTTWGKISKRAHVIVGWIYFAAAYASLVIINGIITFMLTPGRWLETHAFWDGFFNPTYWPALLLRTGIVILMATVFMVFPALKTAEARRTGVLRYLGKWFVGGVLLSYAGYRLWEAALPETILNLFTGGSPALATLAATRSFILWALTAALALAVVILIARPKLARPAAAVVLAASTFAFFAGYERLREGARKPFLIHSHLFSNGLLVSDIAKTDTDGVLGRSGWAARGAVDPVAVGQRVFLTECASCHTIDGYQGIRSLLPTSDDLMSLAAATDAESVDRVFADECASCHRDLGGAEMKEMLPTLQEMQDDPEMIDDLNRGMIAGAVLLLQEMGDSYVDAPAATVIDTAGLHAPYMPPFVGTDDERDALVAYLATLTQRDRGSQRLARSGGVQ